MDRKQKEQLLYQISQLKNQAATIAGHLDGLAAAIKVDEWQAVWTAVYRKYNELRKLVPGLQALSRQLVKLSIAERVEKDPPWKLAVLVHTILSKYLDIHGGVYEALYAELVRQDRVQPVSIESDPQLADVCLRMEQELALLAQTDPPTAATLRLCDAIELGASALQLICADKPETRAQLAVSLETALERHLPDAATALELLLPEE